MIMTRGLRHVCVIAGLVSFALAGCVQLAVPIKTIAVDAKAPTVAVLVTDENPLYLQPVDGFVDNLRANVHVFSLAGTAQRLEVARALNALKPDLVFALGSRAAQYARAHAENTPTAFAVVVSHDRIKDLDAANVAGIDYQLPAVMEFIRYRMVMPSLKRVAAFHTSEVSQSYIEKTKKELKGFGVELITTAVSSGEDLQSRYAQATQDCDSVWYLSDPSLVNRKTFEFLNKQTKSDGLALLTPFSQELTKAGALMSVSVDLNTLGPQAAHIAKRLLFQGVSPSEIGVETPIGAQFTVNLTTARAIKLEISPFAAQTVNRFVGH